MVKIWRKNLYPAFLFSFSIFKLTQLLYYIPFWVSRPGPLLNWKVSIDFKIRESPKWYKYKCMCIWCLLHNLEFGHAHHCNKGISQRTRQEWQTVLLQMRWLFMSHLIWIYTVCKDTCFDPEDWKGSNCSRYFQESLYKKRKVKKKL